MTSKLPDFFYQIFDPALPRLGPGDTASTMRALRSFTEHSPSSADRELRVLDVGCGNGTPTLLLARHLNASILAVDNHQPYLDELLRRAQTAHVSDRISVLLADMADLQLEDETFDLIWSEGALSIMGFREGLQVMRSLLKPNGALAVTEIVWLTPEPPPEAHGFLTAQCPLMTGVPSNLKMIADCGFDILDHFTLPDSSWLFEYFAPLEMKLRELRAAGDYGAEETAIINSVEAEIALFRKYQGSYGYEFFVMKNPPNS
ncbi:class I SAM-dependent methyltransferase [bacterium]|nr:class I SAM-dependent methyltransferase [bacterium]MBU1637723.1 class I SAM-dependent methyltransferase [bacterium]